MVKIALSRTRHRYARILRKNSPISIVNFHRLIIFHLFIPTWAYTSYVILTTTKIPTTNLRIVIPYYFRRLKNMSSKSSESYDDFQENSELTFHTRVQFHTVCLFFFLTPNTCKRVLKPCEKVDFL